MSLLKFSVATFTFPHACTHVYQVKGIVRQNINKVVARGEKLDDIGDKAGMT